MTSSYIWEHRQQRARHQYVYARYILFKPILMDARTGTLDPNWRQGLSAAPIVAASETDLEDCNRLAVHDISTMDIQPWEPRADSGWRTALDAWYAALLELNDSRDRGDVVARVRCRCTRGGGEILRDDCLQSRTHGFR